MTIIVLAALALAVGIDVLRAARRKAELPPPPPKKTRISVDLRRRW